MIVSSGLRLAGDNAQAASASGPVAERQCQGRSSCRRCAGCSAMRVSTSASQACGSTPLSFAVTISVAMAAARSAPRPEPANSHALRPSAKPLSERSAALFVRQIRPSSRKWVKPGQRRSR
uniref:Transposase n=1 Tax=Pseudomonas sp. K-62 TaxID=76885 RepID=I2FG31_9PSED|nr:transposase [Pseudomonas sp. K-62]